MLSELELLVQLGDNTRAMVFVLNSIPGDSERYQHLLDQQHRIISALLSTWQQQSTKENRHGNQAR